MHGFTVTWDVGHVFTRLHLGSVLSQDTAVFEFEFTLTWLHCAQFANGAESCVFSKQSPPPILCHPLFLCCLYHPSSARV